MKVSLSWKLLPKQLTSSWLVSDEKGLCAAWVLLKWISAAQNKHILSTFLLKTTDICWLKRDIKPFFNLFYQKRVCTLCPAWVLRKWTSAVQNKHILSTFFTENYRYLLIKMGFQTFFRTFFYQKICSPLFQSISINFSWKNGIKNCNLFC